jgi:hypothetical protein
MSLKTPSTSRREKDDLGLLGEVSQVCSPCGVWQTVGGTERDQGGVFSLMGAKASSWKGEPLTNLNDRPGSECAQPHVLGIMEPRTQNFVRKTHLFAGPLAHNRRSLR